MTALGTIKVPISNLLFNKILKVSKIKAPSEVRHFTSKQDANLTKIIQSLLEKSL